MVLTEEISLDMFVHYIYLYLFIYAVTKTKEIQWTFFRSFVGVYFYYFRK